MSINWGFLGAGMVASKALAPAVKAAANANLYAVASKDIKRAQALSPTLTYDNYEALIADPAVTAVYISLPNNLHAKWAIKAMQAGKHVLCEKPFATTAAEAISMFEAAQVNQRLLVEAIWFRWHPRFQKAQELISSGAIGELKEITATFTFQNTTAGNYRFDPGAGGGALLDVGPYLIHSLVALVGSGAVFEINQISQNIGPTGVDLTTKANATINNSINFNMLASFEAGQQQELVITGGKGSVSFPLGEVFTNWHQVSQLKLNDQILDFDPVDPYQIMVESVSSQITGANSWLTPSEETIAVMKILDLIKSQAN
jgi:D-xylose 1-dehydrogenase (NADP+, D-xylono-1,5-lactone-forming)